MSLLEVNDLTPFATIQPDKAAAMVADAIALAMMVAPCLTAPLDTLSAEQVAATRAVLRAAVLRWHETGSGAVSSETAGPFSQAVDTRQSRRTMFWPSEIAALQRICKSARAGGAFNVDTAAPSPMLFHATFCSYSGSGWCNCGAIAFDNDWFGNDWYY